MRGLQSPAKSEEEEETNYDFLSQIAMENDLDLREYTEKVARDLEELQQLAGTDLLDLDPEVAQLYSELSMAERSFSKLEQMLGGLQTELREIASHVDPIKARSARITTVAVNKKELEQGKQPLRILELYKYISTVLISPTVVKQLACGKINEEYLGRLRQLDATLFQLRQSELLTSQATKELAPVIEKLKVRIIGRLRNFLIATMEPLKKPRTNICIIQQNSLLKYKELPKFIKNHGQAIFLEISNHYCELMCGLYMGFFQSYVKSLSGLQTERITRHDEILADEAESMNAGTGPRISVFNLGTREQVLQAIDDQPIICHISQDHKVTHPLEEVFRSQNKLLIEAVIQEFVFVLDFFDLRPHQCSYIFNAIFKSSVTYYLEVLRNSVTNSYDCIALLLMYRINGYYKDYMGKKGVPILDLYFDHVADVASEDAETVHEVRDGPDETVPAALSCSYVDLVTAIHKVTQHQLPEMLVTRLDHMREAFAEVLRRLGGQVTNPKQRLALLLNNLHYIGEAFKDLRGDKTEDLSAFVKEFDSSAPRYVASLLQPQFESLLEVVRKYTVPASSEAGLQLDSEAKLADVNCEYLESVGNDFACSWDKKLDNIKQTIGQDICAESNAKQLFLRLLKELMINYSPFCEIVRRCHPEYFKELTSQHVLLDLKNLSISLLSSSASSY